MRNSLVLHLTSGRMAFVKETNNKCWWEREERSLYTVGGSVDIGVEDSQKNWR